MRIRAIHTTIGAATLLASIFSAETATAGESKDRDTNRLHGSYVVMPADDSTAEETNISKIIYLDRCKGGCVLEPGTDARLGQSRILSQTVSMSEFQYSDELWDEVVSCVQRVYAPFDVEITDVNPGSEKFHHRAIVAGTSSEAGQPSGVGGVAPIGPNCAPINNVISFTFANVLGGGLTQLCATVAQETAHAFGLDHEYHCSDPMTYLSGCGLKFFRDVSLDCGTFNGPEQCLCGGAKQNSHRKLLTVFGPGPGSPPPEVEIQLPADGATVERDDGIFTQSSDERGVSRLELVINGYKWDQNIETISTAAPRETFPAVLRHTFSLPANIPEGVQNIDIRAYNDTGVFSTASISVTLGSPCTGPEQCLDGQSCDAGACSWPPATGEVGDPCERKQDCLSDLCPDNNGDKRCSVLCNPTVQGACDAEFECLQAGGPSDGVCWPLNADEGGGCCSVGKRDNAPWLELLFFGLVLGVVVRRRTR